MNSRSGWCCAFEFSCSFIGVSVVGIASRRRYWLGLNDAPNPNLIALVWPRSVARHKKTHLHGIAWKIRPLTYLTTSVWRDLHERPKAQLNFRTIKTLGLTALESADHVIE